MTSKIAAAEREWLLPCLAMTIGLALAGLALRPAGDTQSVAFFAMFPLWAKYVLVAELLWLFSHLVRLKLAGVASPLAYFRHEYDWRHPLVVGLGALLAGLNMICFMWIKPELNRFAPFRADEAIADAERAMFGIDLWRLFDGIDLNFMALTYNILWFWALFVVLIWLLIRAPSRARSASLVNYFFLWSLFGPIGQYLLPAAGPLFYQRIGLGDRFAGLEANVPDLTIQISDYLWTHYSAQTLGFGAGVSAMPSLHIATVAWMVISLRAVGSRWTIPVLLFSLYIFVASVALGWHYALDGVAGAAGALAGHRLSRAALGYDWSMLRRSPRFGWPAADL